MTTITPTKILNSQRFLIVNQLWKFAEQYTLTSRVTVATKHPQLLEDGWKRRTFPFRGADGESMSSTNNGRTLGLKLNNVLVCTAELTSSTHTATRASFSAFNVDHVQYTTPWTRGTDRYTHNNSCIFIYSWTRWNTNSSKIWKCIRLSNCAH